MLVLGGVYKTVFENGICRIIGMDEFEVFYDSSTYDGKWMFSGNFKKKVIFYRYPKELFELRSELIEIEELSETELEFFRPDLPMRFGRNNEVLWNDDVSNNKFLKEEFGTETLNVNKIMLTPFGSNGGIKKSELIQSDEKLNVFEIIKKAKELCDIYNSEQVSGIGFYRSGFQNGVPSYYIGGYVDKAEIMKNK